MTNPNELNELIEKALAKGATVNVAYDFEAAIYEGRDIIETVTVSNLPGCGPCAMSAIAASERLRSLV